MRAGTTFLYHQLKANPHVFMPTLKEPRYFNHALDDPERGNMVPRGLPVTFEEYESLFANARTDQLIGEASPQYINSHVAARQIKSHFPEAKIIATIRDPASRLYSMWLKELPNPGESSFIDFFEEQKDAWFVRSNFTHENLSRYYDCFDKAHIKVVCFEDLTRGNSLAVAEVMEFLGVEPEAQPVPDTPTNEGGVPNSLIAERIFRRLRGRRGLGQLVRKFAPNRIVRFGKALRRANMTKAPTLSDEHRQEVNRFFIEDTCKLERLIGRDLPSWRE